MKGAYYDRSDEVIEEVFKSILSRYQIGLEKSMIGSDFIFDCVDLLHCKFHEINLELVGSYIDSPDRIKNKKSNRVSYRWWW